MTLLSPVGGLSVKKPVGAAAGWCIQPPLLLLHRIFSGYFVYSGFWWLNKMLEIYCLCMVS